MAKKLAVVPELVFGLPDLRADLRDRSISACNNPKKSAVRVLVTYPHPVMRLPIVCSQCKVPLCADACPVGALKRTNGVVRLDTSGCISCMKCVEACPFGAIYAHGDLDHPIKCDLCGGEPQCVEKCPKGRHPLHPRAVAGRGQADEQRAQLHPHEGNRVHRKGREEDDPLRRDRQRGTVGVSVTVDGDALTPSRSCFNDDRH